jgi:hypothetical protein
VSSACRSSLGIALLALGTLAPLHAGERERELLRGLGSFVVDAPDPGDGTETGITADWVRGVAVERLAQQALPKSEGDQSPDAARLQVRVGTVRIDKYHYAYSVRLDLLERATLARQPDLAGQVESWSTAETLAYGLTRNVKEQIRAELLAKIDLFIDDYLAVN